MKVVIIKIFQKIITFSYLLMGKIDKDIDFKQDGLYRSELKMFIKSFMKSMKSKRVLDVGSGEWSWTKETLLPFCDIITFDIIKHDNVDVVGDIYEISKIFKRKPKFDFIIVTDVFEHLPNIDSAVKELLRILKSGGTIIISSPFRKELHGEDYGDYWRITRQGWRHLLKPEFDNIQIKWVGAANFPKAYLISAKKRN